MNDHLTALESGLTRLLERLGSEHPRYTEALTLQSRLSENISAARIYGDTETRRAERAQTVDTMNRLVLEVLGTSFNDLCKGAPLTESTLIQPSAPFVGLRPFRPEDASLFFGRDQCLKTLASKLLDENWPLLIINGLSGVGKSSLLAAGLIPLLRKKGHAVACANILDSPESDVIRGIRRDFPGIERANSILDAINLACSPGQLLFLIVDQVERCFTLTHNSEEHLGFWRGMAHLLRGEARCSIKVVFTIRSDWLHAFQMVTPTPLDLPVFSFLALVTPLDVEEAKEAMMGPLEHLNIAYEPELIDIAIKDLASADGKVDPPQLQIVGEALYRHMKEHQANGSREAKLTLQNYHSLHGARAIIRGHLMNTIEHLGPDVQTGWQILLKLVGPDNQRLSKRSKDIRGNLSDQVFNRIVENLVVARLIVREFSTDGAPVYTLTHDYLVEEINQHFGENRELQAWKTAERYLDTGVADWRDAQRTTGQELLLERDRYAHIWTQREALGALTEEVNEFLVRSALYHGESSFTYWLARLPDSCSQMALTAIVDYCLRRGDVQRQVAQRAVVEAIRKNMLSDEHQKYLKDRFWREFTVGEEPHPAETAQSITRKQRESAATILWALRKLARLSEASRFTPVAARTWLVAHRQQFIASAVGVLLALALIFGFLSVRKGLKGKWYPIHTLFAGPIRAAALSQDTSEFIYVVTSRGPRPGDGATLLQSDGSTGWEILNRSFTYSPILLLLATSSNGRPRIYASVYGKGILRSDDNGKNWRSINAGLYTYYVNSLVADPSNPDILYAGSADKKGVFQSQDGGKSWRDISGNELFGVSVPSLTYTPYKGGVFLAGTDDGRILTRRQGESAWQLVSAYPGVGGIICISAEPEEGQYIYAGTSAGTVLMSSNGGDDWTFLNKIPGVFSITSIAAVPGGPDVVYMDAVGIGGHILWKSEDGGQTWHHVTDDLFTREDLKWLLIPKHAPGKLYVAGSPGLFETQNGGDSWTFYRNVGAPLAVVSKMAISPLEGGPTYAAVGGSVYSSIDPKAGEWMRGKGLLATVIRDVVPDPENPNIAYAGVYLPNKWSVFVTPDGGKTWQSTAIPPGIPEKYLNDTMALDVALVNGSKVLFAGTNGCGVLHSTDQGANWQTWGRRDCSLPSDAPKNILDLAIDPHWADRVYVAADSTRVYVTEDRGRSWRSRDMSFTTEISAIEVDPKIAGRVYLIAGSAGFWRSDDGAETWKSYTIGAEEKPLSAMVVIPDKAETLFVGTGNGEVWKSTDGGQRWISANEGLDVPNVLTLTSAETEREILLTSWYGMYYYQPGSLEGLQR